MIDYNDRLIQKQSEIISELNQKITYLRDRIERLEVKNQARVLLENKKLQDAADRYNDLITQIQENPILLGEWERFLSFLKISASEDYLEQSNAYS